LTAGVLCEAEASPILVNCLIALNLSGGVVCSFNAAPRLVNCTVSENCGGIFSAVQCSPFLRNCIVYGNVGNQIEVSEDAKLDVSFSCIGGDHVWPGEGNVNADPLFLEPGNGDRLCGLDSPWDDSWTGDYHLQAGSPCIDTGGAIEGVVTDIEGNARQCGAGVDMGAYERGGCQAAGGEAFLRGDCNSDGALELADAVAVLSYHFVGGESPTCRDTADTNDDGVIDITDGIAIIWHFFADTGPLPEPFGECGIDPTVDDVTCAEFSPCRR
jgi:hypothetical protein